MYYLYELARARDAHHIYGGVLLDFQEVYVVCQFEDAVELRCDDIADPHDLATYWAAMAECGYDETAPMVQTLIARMQEQDTCLTTSRP
jgi:hypothetical protein